jgi:formamidopyrimidine-DNA glycosylase
MVVNQALAKMRRGEPAFGYALEMGSPVAAEVLAESGVDFLMVDTQHGSYNNPESTAFSFMAISTGRSTPMARVATNNYTQIGRLLDEGAQGIIVPMVDTPEQAQAQIDKLGPDPLVGDPLANEERFVAGVRKRNVAIALLLMDQAVVSGIGNVYRAELLFRARQNPFTPGKELPEDVVRALWRDWVHLMGIGVETGQMLTMDDLSPEDLARAMASRDDRHWVYHRTGLPCRVCGTPIAMQELGGRKLYWCPVDQA